MSNLLSKASILLTPTATSDGKLHNVKPNTTTGDFTFTRATTATRVNSSGLIESVASGLPRIDFLGGTGQILLEPASTNTATYSNDFTQGDIFSGSADPTLSDAILTANQGTAPEGTNTAQLLKDDNDGSTGRASLNYFATNVVSDNFNTVSIFAKKSLSNDLIYIQSDGFDTDANGRSWFNIQNGTLGTVQSQHTSKIEDYGNGWYRCSITFKTTTDLIGSVRVNLASTDNNTNVTRDGTNGVLLFGVQAEADASRNFSTSYIPTSGSTVTRNKDQANNSGDSSLISSTEGVLYAEIAALADDSIARNIALGNGANLQNTVEIYYDTGSQSIRFRIRANNSVIVNSATSLTDRTQFAKAAIKYKSGEIKGFINGVQVLSTTDSFTFSNSLSELAFDRGSGANEFEGKVKSVAVFKEALTDAQLISLTS
jgi:hypothetical protein